MPTTTPDRTHTLESPEPAAATDGRMSKALAIALVLARRMARFEAGVWRSLARWLARRPAVPHGGTPFGYRGPAAAPILAFFGLSALETVILDVIVSHLGAWSWLRVLLLVLGIWGAVLMLGMFAGVTVHPHVVAPSGLRVRHGATFDAHIPWDAVAAVREVRGGRSGRSVQVDGDTLHVVVVGQTTVALTLTRPVTVALSPERTADITALQLYADDAAALVAAVRTRIEPGVPQ